MLINIAILLACQLIGEIIVSTTQIPIPGPVVGMAILFVGLIVRGELPDGLSGTADALLRHLSLLFVPAGVGITLHIDLVSAEFIPIVAAVVISTVLTIGVTAAVMRLLSGGDANQ